VGTLGTICSQVTIFVINGIGTVDVSHITQEIPYEIGQIDGVLKGMDRIL